MSAITRLRATGFTVSLVDGERLEIAPASELSDRQLQWLRDNKSMLLAELKTEAANEPDSDEPMLRQCSECRHDLLSRFNPTGGLTRCNVRGKDVPMMIWGTRTVACGSFERVAA